MSARLDEVLGVFTHRRHAFPIRANLSQGRSEAARATGISVVWRRRPITTVTIALVMAIWIYDYLSVPSAADSATLRSNAIVEHAPPIPLTAPGSHAFAERTGRAQAKAAIFAFKRIQVGQNEVDYVAEDVTIRLFTAKPAPMRIPHWNGQRNIGSDVTVRYFEYEPAPMPQARPASAAIQSEESSLLVSK